MEVGEWYILRGISGACRWVTFESCDLPYVDNVSEIFTGTNEVEQMVFLASQYSQA